MKSQLEKKLKNEDSGSLFLLALLRIRSEPRGYWKEFAEREETGNGILNPSRVKTFGTHGSRTRVGHTSCVWPPLVVVSFLVGKGPIEDSADVSHGVNTDRRATEH